MAALVPSGQPTQLIGLPALPDETYRQLDKCTVDVYEKYQRRLAERDQPKDDPSDYYTI